MKRAESEGGWLARVANSIVESLESEITAGRKVDPFQRDPEFVARIMPLLRALNLYFGSEVRGWENIPKRGPMLIIANHSGGAATTDPASLFEKWVDERGPDSELYSLGYDLDFTYPRIGTMLRKIGILPASQANAREALRRRAAVLVFPGGDYEVFRPWRERNKIAFGGRTGFIELAIATGVPVVPMTIHGAHQSTIVLTRGHRLARAAGLNRLHIKVFPFIWNIPLGLTPAFVPSIQLPAKITVELGRPLRWSRYRPSQARDRRIVKRCYDEITTVMQATLDDLAAEHPYPVLERLVELQPSRLLRKLMSRNARPRTAREVGSTPPRRGRQPPAKRRPRHAATKKRTPRD